jgi:hypothetical protein
MARYYFDLIDGQTLHDEHGQEMPNLPAVRDEAARILGEIVRDEFPGDGSERELRVRVRDAAGTEVMVVSLNYDVNPPLS